MNIERSTVLLKLFRTQAALAALMAFCCCSVPLVLADEAPQTVDPIKHQITGLFSPDRVRDLKEVFEKLPNIKLIKVDFENAEATVEYDPAKAFPGARSDQIVERFDNQLRGVSNSTFGVKPLRTIEKEKLTLIEIPIVGLDCKACCLAAYESVYKLPGVERATASFKEGRVTALVNPEMIDRVELEKALKQRGVQLPSP
ncbi:MAG: heavy-metal-associated domain-containing protein [Planctomycetes bacterium]|nr:heavy-metal-associated domain-containing protein [Planctomycetota bacterium]